MLEAICHKMFRLARELETSQICLKYAVQWSFSILYIPDITGALHAVSKASFQGNFSRPNLQPVHRVFVQIHTMLSEKMTLSMLEP